EGGLPGRAARVDGGDPRRVVDRAAAEGESAEALAAGESDVVDARRWRDLHPAGLRLLADGIGAGAEAVEDVLATRVRGHRLLRAVALAVAVLVEVNRPAAHTPPARVRRAASVDVVASQTPS